MMKLTREHKMIIAAVAVAVIAGLLFSNYQNVLTTTISVLLLAFTFTFPAAMALLFLGYCTIGQLLFIPSKSMEPVSIEAFSPITLSIPQAYMTSRSEQKGNVGPIGLALSINHETLGPQQLITDKPNHQSILVTLRRAVNPSSCAKLTGDPRNCSDSNRMACYFAKRQDRFERLAPFLDEASVDELQQLQMSFIQGKHNIPPSQYSNHEIVYSYNDYYITSTEDGRDLFISCERRPAKPQCRVETQIAGRLEGEYLVPREAFMANWQAEDARINQLIDGFIVKNESLQQLDNCTDFMTPPEQPRRRR